MTPPPRGANELTRAQAYALWRRSTGKWRWHPARPAEVHVHAAALYVSMLKNGYYDEATEFAEWYLDTFDHDLET